MSPRRPSFSFNASWLHVLGVATTAMAVVVGLSRFMLIDRHDPYHCGSMMNRGSWLDRAHQNWQPDGCMMHKYQPNDASSCLTSRQLVFIGDSVTRRLFFQLAHLLDPALPTSPPDNEHKHEDYELHSKAGTQFSFYWDPFLNGTHTHSFMMPQSDVAVEGATTRRPALLVLGSGLWYLRYSKSSGGIRAWEANVEIIFNSIKHGRPKPADQIVLMPVEAIVPSKLSPERADSMRASDIDAMNSDLFHRLNPPSKSYFHFFPSLPLSIPVSLPLVFNQMLDPSQTEDGLHFSKAVVKIQANLLLNSRCNDVLPKKFPFDKTCCRRYPWPSALQLIILALAILWGPSIWFFSRQSGPLIKEEQIPALVCSAAVALIYVADRTGFWLKEQKQFDPWMFALLCLAALAVGLATVKRADKDLGFLNREQTDEWKGWMQIVILIYHYLGASKISGIYNPIRVLVAGYLFMSGYGHTTFYIRKADFSFLRVAQVMVRLNLLTVLLAYTMNTDYISYYFAPLVSMWFLIIYGTMAIGSQYNDRTIFLVFKFIASASAVTWFMREQWLLEILFDFFKRVCGIHWSAREWSFRVNLDLWIVYFGMFAALAVIKFREHRLSDHPQWPLAVKIGIGASCLVLLWYFAFELFQESKFTYNLWHPYISFLPITAFVILRNANSILRSGSSRTFAFIGTCSLETFIIQYHLWLAGDTKGILLVIPGTQWRPVNVVITTTMFIYVSHRVAQATGDITAWTCGGTPKSLPAPATSSSAGPLNTYSSSRQERLELMILPLTPQSDDHVGKDNDGNPLPPEPDTPTRPRRWVDRLAEGSPPRSRIHMISRWHEMTQGTPGVKVKLMIGIGCMWIVNLLWLYP